MVITRVHSPDDQMTFIHFIVCILMRDCYCSQLFPPANSSSRQPLTQPLRKMPNSEKAAAVFGGSLANSNDATPAPTQPMQLDNHGDLLLHVGAPKNDCVKSQGFKVCSATMRRTSLVWEKMLFGPWKESKPSNGDWIVNLPGDKPWPTGLLLRIAHGRFAAIPNTLSLSQLCDILIVADKYDVVHLIQPWANSWSWVVRNTPKSLTAMDGAQSERVLRLHAAWELGFEDIVAEEMTNFVFNLSLEGLPGGPTNRLGAGFYSYNDRLFVLDSTLGPHDFMGKWFFLYHSWYFR